MNNSLKAYLVPSDGLGKEVELLSDSGTHVQGRMISLTHDLLRLAHVTFKNRFVEGNSDEALVPINSYKSMEIIGLGQVLLSPTIIEDGDE